MGFGALLRELVSSTAVLLIRRKFLVGLAGLLLLAWLLILAEIVSARIWGMRLPGHPAISPAVLVGFVIKAGIGGLRSRAHGSRAAKARDLQKRRLAALQALQDLQARR